ncbi:MAG: UDP-glucose/GDP-mannose dehydrogenase family protein [Actinomycetota bacterium]|nr:UDP-glucose/GDP-mannose dehydrogenase family protein [Actinomycetota bacterium]
MRISVLGTGYLGATHAACLAALGHEVIGIDRDPGHIARLRTGRAPFHEPGLNRLLEEAVADGRLSFGTDLSAAAAHATVHFICVGTPERAGGRHADLTDLHAVVDELAPLLHGPALVIGKSTVPVGTAQDLLARLQGGAPTGVDVDVAWNPEFLREGAAVQDSLSPDRLVFGVTTSAAQAVLRSIYASLITRGVPVVITDLATAELAKASANVMLAARVSMLNVLAEVCEAAHADVSDLVAILGLDPRIGPDYLSPGVGFGGGCLPKDLRAFVARAGELGVGGPLRLLREVDRVNRHQQRRTVRRVSALLDGSVEGRPITVLGAAFKADSDDIRESPALAIATQLAVDGARVTVHDPAALDRARRAHPELDYDADLLSACTGAELVLVLTDWPEFAGADSVSLASVVARPVVFDGRLVLDADKWRAAGWSVHTVGRGEI